MAVDRPALASINGEIVPLAEATISAQDRGFLLGDAVYEVIRVYQGQPWLMQEHMDRLAYSLNEVRIRGIDVPRLQQRILHVLRQGNFAEAMIYIQITRGSAPRKHAFPDNVSPLEFFYVQEWQDSYVSLRQTGGSAITHPDLRWGRCDIKSTNLLGNVLAQQAAVEAGGVEALLYRPDGTVTEGTHSSFFGVAEGVLLTTPQSSSILPGITRNFLRKLCQQENIPYREQYIRRVDLYSLTELFLTGTGSEVLPLVRVDDRVIGSGEPGPVTRQLQKAYREEVQKFLRGL